MDVVSVGEGYRTWMQMIEDAMNDRLQPRYTDEVWNTLQGVAPPTDRVAYAFLQAGTGIKTESNAVCPIFSYRDLDYVLDFFVVGHCADRPFVRFPCREPDHCLI